MENNYAQRRIVRTYEYILLGKNCSIVQIHNTYIRKRSKNGTHKLSTKKKEKKKQTKKITKFWRKN